MAGVNKSLLSCTTVATLGQNGLKQRQGKGSEETFFYLSKRLRIKSQEQKNTTTVTRIYGSTSPR